MPWVAMRRALIQFPGMESTYKVALPPCGGTSPPAQTTHVQQVPDASGDRRKAPRHLRKGAERPYCMAVAVSRL